MEIWKDIPGYEGFYQASSLGRIRSIPFASEDKIGRIIHYKGKVLKQYQNRRTGYMYVHLLSKAKPVHRLVLAAFTGRFYDLDVNHINCDKKDNRLINLEWCDRRENIKHAIRNGIMDIGPMLSKARERNDKNKKKVIAIIDGEKQHFESVNEASRKTGIDPRLISNCCHGKASRTKGIIFKFGDTHDA